MILLGIAILAVLGGSVAIGGRFIFHRTFKSSDSSTDNRQVYNQPTIHGGECLPGCSGVSARAGNNARMHELREAARRAEVEGRVKVLSEFDQPKAVPFLPAPQNAPQDPQIEIRNPGESEWLPVGKQDVFARRD
jgi:hypothetical protein